MWDKTSSSSIYMFPHTVQGKSLPILGLRREGVSCGWSLSLSFLCPLNSLPFSLLEDTQYSASQPLFEKLQSWTNEKQVLLLSVLRQRASALLLYPLHIHSALVDPPFHTGRSLPHTPATSHLRPALLWKHAGPLGAGQKWGSGWERTALGMAVS